jgi:hypothetical protein
MPDNTELLAAISDLVAASSASHTTDLLREAGAEIARLNSEVTRLQAQRSVAARRPALTACEREALLLSLRIGSEAGALHDLLSVKKVGALRAKLYFRQHPRRHNVPAAPV